MTLLPRLSGSTIDVVPAARRYGPLHPARDALDLSLEALAAPADRQSLSTDPRIQALHRNVRAYDRPGQGESIVVWMTERVLHGAGRFEPGSFHVPLDAASVAPVRVREGPDRVTDDLFKPDTRRIDIAYGIREVDLVEGYVPMAMSPVFHARLIEIADLTLGKHQPVAFP